jgi:hypothetical protein
LELGVSLELGAWDLGFSSTSISVPEMPDAGEDHRHIAIVGGGDDLIVPD